MTRSTTAEDVEPQADAPESTNPQPEPAAAATPSEDAPSTDVPVPIDLTGLDFEQHVAAVQGGYTITTED